ncbi:MAG: formylglycine-generating enzyme family protein, partial [Methylococcales bacterium]
RAFVDTTGFPIGNTNALRDPDNRPVRYVSWQEALAYCNWLNDLLKNVEAVASSEISGRVRSGRWRVDLPSELEWEKAARGDLRDRIFPWGDEPDPNRANYDESQIADTSAVGCFPPNDFGLYDMIGNVWEWTRSLWGKDWGSLISSILICATIRDAKLWMRATPSCGSCAAVRGAAAEAAPAAPTATGFSRSTATTTWVFGWCCVPPLFPSLVL